MKNNRLGKKIITFVATFALSISCLSFSSAGLVSVQAAEGDEGVTGGNVPTISDTEFHMAEISTGLLSEGPSVSFTISLPATVDFTLNRETGYYEYDFYANVKKDMSSKLGIVVFVPTSIMLTNESIEKTIITHGRYTYEDPQWLTSQIPHLIADNSLSGFEISKVKTCSSSDEITGYEKHYMLDCSEDVFLLEHYQSFETRDDYYIGQYTGTTFVSYQVVEIFY